MRVYVRMLLTGIVTLAEQLDYESISQCHLLIAVYDATDHSLVSKTHLTVDLNNVNDHAPTFSHKEYLVFLPEDCIVGTFVIQLVATDADSCHGNPISVLSISLSSICRVATATLRLN